MASTRKVVISPCQTSMRSRSIIRDILSAEGIDQVTHHGGHHQGDTDHDMGQPVPGLGGPGRWIILHVVFFILRRQRIKILPDTAQQNFPPPAPVFALVEHAVAILARQLTQFCRTLGFQITCCHYWMSTVITVTLSRAPARSASSISAWVQASMSWVRRCRM